MGANPSMQKDADVQFAWPEEKRLVAERALKSGNPKVIKFRDFKFPVEDPVKMVVYDSLDKKSIKLKSYMYPAYHDAKQQMESKSQLFKNGVTTQEMEEMAKKQTSKGVVFYVHGFSDYNGRFAHVGQMMSTLGYDYFCMDMRGHGKSGGRTVYIPSMTQIQNDQIAFQKKVIKQFYDINNHPPIFIIAHSLGCAQMMNILMDEYDPSKPNKLAPLKYSSVTMCNPFFGLKQKKLIKLVQPILKTKYLINDQAYCPEVKPKESEMPEHILPWCYDVDNRLQRKIIPVHTTLQLFDNCDSHQKNLKLCKKKNKKGEQILNPYGRIDLPLYVIVGKKDKVVCNETAREIYEQLLKQKGGKPREFVEFSNLDHGPFSDGLIYKEICKQIDSWFTKTGEL